MSNIPLLPFAMRTQDPLFCKNAPFSACWRTQDPLSVTKRPIWTRFGADSGTCVRQSRKMCPFCRINGTSVRQIRDDVTFYARTIRNPDGGLVEGSFVRTISTRTAQLTNETVPLAARKFSAPYLFALRYPAACASSSVQNISSALVAS